MTAFSRYGLSPWGAAPPRTAYGVVPPGQDGVPPLHGEYLHRPGVGRRHRKPHGFCAHRIGLPPVGAGSKGGRLYRCHSDCQAPRWLLPLGQCLHGTLCAKQPISCIIEFLKDRREVYFCNAAVLVCKIALEIIIVLANTIFTCGAKVR